MNSTDAVFVPTVMHVLLHEEDGIWLAHCLDCDFVAQGPDMASAKENLRSGLEALIAEAHGSGTTGRLWSLRAPPEFWERFGNS